MKMWQYYLLLYILFEILSFAFIFMFEDVFDSQGETGVIVFIAPAICLAVFIYRNAPPLKK